MKKHKMDRVIFEKYKSGVLTEIEIPFRQSFVQTKHDNNTLQVYYCFTM